MGPLGATVHNIISVSSLVGVTNRRKIASYIAGYVDKLLAAYTIIWTDTPLDDGHTP